MTFIRIIVLASALLLTLPLPAATSLTPHTAVYKVKIKVVSGQLNTELSKTPTGFVARHVIRSTGMSRLLTRGTMDVTAQFESTPIGILPGRYHAVDTIRDDPDVDVSFDWDSNEATSTVGATEHKLPLEAIAFDNVSIQYALMQDLLNDNLGEHYNLFDVDETKPLDISRIGTKNVETKAGTFSAIGIQHQKQGSSRVTTLWCVEELGFLPVIIEQHRKGKLNFRASLLEYNPSQK